MAATSFMVVGAVLGTGERWIAAIIAVTLGLLGLFTTASAVAVVQPGRTRPARSRRWTSVLSGAQVSFRNDVLWIDVHTDGDVRPVIICPRPVFWSSDSHRQQIEVAVERIRSIVERWLVHSVHNDSVGVVDVAVGV